MINSTRVKALLQVPILTWGERGRDWRTLFFSINIKLISKIRENICFSYSIIAFL